MGKGRPSSWFDGENTTEFKFEAFEDNWTKECAKTLDQKPTRVVVVNTDYVAEGIDIRGVEIVLGLSSYLDGNVMEQAFGRADRMCHHDLFRHETKSGDVDIRTQEKMTRKQYCLHQDGKALEGPNHKALNTWTTKEDMDTSLYAQSFRTSD